MRLDNNTTWQDGKLLRLSLQFFAEGGGEGGTGGDSSGSGDMGAPAGGTGTDTTTSTGGSTAEKDFFEQMDTESRNAFLKKHGLMHHQAATKRYQGSVDKAGKYDALTSHLEAVAERYGVSVDDPEAFAKAILNDPDRVRAKAREMGVTEDVAKSLVAADANEALSKARAAQQVRADAFARAQAQEQEVKAAYPDFDMAKAQKNPAFKALYDTGNFSMREAYEMAFGRELHAAAIEVAKQEARAAALAEREANEGRPREGAAGYTGNASVDPSKLTGKALDDFLESFMTH